MPDSTNTLPEEIIKASRAFTETLQMENAVFQAQLNGAIAMTIHAVTELIGICKEAVAIGNADKVPQGQQKVSDAAQQALSEVQNANKQAGNSATPGAASSLPSTPITNAVLDQEVLQAVAMSYNNAVAAQQQSNILQQAATTQIISTILSLATATLGVAVKNAETA